MATIVKEINLKARPEAVWDALRDFQAVHTRVAPGFLTDSKPDGDNARLVSFANGSKFREILVSCDDARSGKMPGDYTFFKPDTRLSSADVQTICAAAREVAGHATGGSQ